MSAVNQSKPISNAIDRLADWTVVPGFSSIGFRLRGLAGSSPDPKGVLRGRTVVVTGANSGIGAAATAGFADLGADVHLVVRNLDRGAEAKAAISERTGSDRLHLHQCDVSSLGSVRALAAELEGSLDGIDVLVHNAGVMTKKRSTSEDGIELTLATHVAGPLLLTELLLPLLSRCAPGRAIFVTSGGMYAERVRPGDLQLAEREFGGSAFYAHAKRLQVILASELDRRHRDEGVTVSAMHPGWADTPGVVDSLPGFHRIIGPILRSPEEGADTILWLAAADEPLNRGGELWMDRRPRGAHRLPWTRDTAEERELVVDRLHQLVHVDGQADGSG